MKSSITQNYSTFEESKIKYSFLDFTHPEESEETILVVSPPNGLTQDYNIRIDLTLNKSIMYPNTKIPVLDKPNKLQQRFLYNIYKNVFEKFQCCFKKACVVTEYHAGGDCHCHAILSLNRPDLNLPAIRKLLREHGFNLNYCEVAEIRDPIGGIKYIFKSRTKFGSKLLYAEHSEAAGRQPQDVIGQ